MPPSPEADVVTELVGPTVIEALTRGEIDTQVATARRYPRQLRTFTSRVLDMATLDQDTAESCLYALPRDGKTIEGPSIRFAELVAAAWQNVRVEGRQVGDDGKFVTARGTCLDLENNVAIAVEVQRRVTGKNGRRYNDDMIGVTSNAAISIALRNAVLKVVPKVYWQPAYLAARTVAIGKADTLVARRGQMLAYFVKLGATNDKVFALLGVTSVEEIRLDHLVTLKGLATAIKDGETTVDDAFAPAAAAAAPTEVKRASASAPSANEQASTMRLASSDGSGTVTVLGQVHELEQESDGYWLTLRTGERIAIATSKEQDVAELLKFGGTDHTLRFVCLPTPANGLALQSFTVAD